MCRPGPRTVPTPQVPKVPGAAGPKDVGIEPLIAAGGRVLFSEDMCTGARQLAREPRELVPEASATGDGEREAGVQAQDAVDLPAADTASTTLFMFFPNLRSRPTGRS